jgi:hypothetical protein
MIDIVNYVIFILYLLFVLFWQLGRFLVWKEEGISINNSVIKVRKPGTYISVNIIIHV